MAANVDARGPRKYLSKNKSIKLFKEKQRRRDEYTARRNELKQQYDQIDSTKIQKFTDFPLTKETLNGLRKCHYFEPTEIQRETIGLALKGHDILGAAKTGSGKTVAFVVPVLERLFQEGWCKTDGLGVLVITPTRELAMQIHEVCCNIGERHIITIGLVIGGKDIQTERSILNTYNIVIGTPGRLLQHMDQNPLFDAMNLQMLVLDEADRILDLGFQREMNAIIENLPENRQTLLFSATQTKSIKDLARLSLKNPMYVSVHENSQHATPETLQQSFIVCEIDKKIDFLWSFIKSHKKQKILIFMATCKQVKFTFDLLCRLKPGVSLMSLYGGLHQMRRMERYKSFCSKVHAVMLATDLAARGLDFPNVNWVVQLDCPEDVNTYIHRAGRTARYKKGGESLLVLSSSERDAMVKQLEDRKIPIKEIKVHPKKIMSVQRKVEALCARDVNLKESAQRAFKSYYKNVFLMKDKAVFDIKQLDKEDVREEYAKSLGLAVAPRIRFIQKHMKKGSNVTEQTATKSISNLNSEEHVSKEKFSLGDDEEDDSDDFLKPKGSVIIHASSDEDNESDSTPIETGQNDVMSLYKSRKVLTKAALAKKVLKKKIKPNVKVVFNDDGEMVQELNQQLSNELSNKIAKDMVSDGYSVEKAKLLMNEEDQVDKETYRNKIKQKHKDVRLKRKDERRKEQMGDAPILGNSENVDEANDAEDGSSESDLDIDPNNMPQSSSSSDEVSSEEDENSNAEESDGTTKRKRKSDENLKRKKIKFSNEDIPKLKSKLTLEDEEDLALHYLQNG